MITSSKVDSRQQGRPSFNGLTGWVPAPARPRPDAFRKTVDSTVTQRFLTDWLTLTHFQHDFSMFSRWASKIAPRISLLIVAVEWRHRLQQASLKIDIVFNVCSLVEPACCRSRETYKYVLFPQQFVLHYHHLAMQSRVGLRFLISSSL
jgi:hypothetical protein